MSSINEFVDKIARRRLFSMDWGNDAHVNKVNPSIDPVGIPRGQLLLSLPDIAGKILRDDVGVVIASEGVEQTRVSDARGLLAEVLVMSSSSSWSSFDSGLARLFKGSLLASMVLIVRNTLDCEKNKGTVPDDQMWSDGTKRCESFRTTLTSKDFSIYISFPYVNYRNLYKSDIFRKLIVNHLMLGWFHHDSTLSPSFLTSKVKSGEGAAEKSSGSHLAHVVLHLWMWIRRCQKYQACARPMTAEEHAVFRCSQIREIPQSSPRPSLQGRFDAHLLMWHCLLLPYK